MPRKVPLLPTPVLLGPLLLLLLPHLTLADSESQLSFTNDAPTPDLQTGESRYKVAAKPEPYKPPKPAPNLDAAFVTHTTPFTTTTRSPSKFRPTAAPSIGPVAQTSTLRPRTKNKRPSFKSNKKVRKVKRRRRLKKKNQYNHKTKLPAALFARTTTASTTTATTRRTTRRTTTATTRRPLPSITTTSFLSQRQKSYPDFIDESAKDTSPSFKSVRAVPYHPSPTPVHKHHRLPSPAPLRQQHSPRPKAPPTPKYHPPPPPRIHSPRPRVPPTAKYASPSPRPRVPPTAKYGSPSPRPKVPPTAKYHSPSPTSPPPRPTSPSPPVRHSPTLPPRHHSPSPTYAPTKPTPYATTQAPSYRYSPSPSSPPLPVAHKSPPPPLPVAHKSPPPPPHSPAPVHPFYDEEDDDYYGYQKRPYSFTYGVKDVHSGNDFHRAEESSGPVTKGSYKVALPDGRIQIVNYRADENGYHASVSYEGEPVYPKPSDYRHFDQNLEGYEPYHPPQRAPQAAYRPPTTQPPYTPPYEAPEPAYEQHSATYHPVRVAYQPEQPPQVKSLHLSGVFDKVNDVLFDRHGVSLPSHQRHLRGTPSPPTPEPYSPSPTPYPKSPSPSDYRKSPSPSAYPASPSPSAYPQSPSPTAYPPASPSPSAYPASPSPSAYAGSPSPSAYPASPVPYSPTPAPYSPSPSAYPQSPSSPYPSSPYGPSAFPTTRSPSTTSYQTTTTATPAPTRPSTTERPKKKRNPKRKSKNYLTRFPSFPAASDHDRPYGTKSLPPKQLREKSRQTPATPTTTPLYTPTTPRHKGGKKYAPTSAFNAPTPVPKKTTTTIRSLQPTRSYYGPYNPKAYGQKTGQNSFEGGGPQVVGKAYKEAATYKEATTYRPKYSKELKEAFGKLRKREIEKKKDSEESAA